MFFFGSYETICPHPVVPSDAIISSRPDVGCAPGPCENFYLTKRVWISPTHRAPTNVSGRSSYLASVLPSSVSSDSTRMFCRRSDHARPHRRRRRRRQQQQLPRPLHSFSIGDAVQRPNTRRTLALANLLRATRAQCAVVHVRRLGAS
jgi:hypothetical protein